MKQLVFDSENGELRVVTDFFAELQGLPVFRFAPGVGVGKTIAPGDALLVLAVAGRKDVVLKAPENCRGVINGLDDWGAAMGSPPSKVLLFVHPSAG